MRSDKKHLALVFAFFVFLIFIVQQYQGRHEKAILDFDYPKFVKSLESGEISDVTFHEDTGEITGQVKADFEKKYGGSKFSIKGMTTDRGFDIVNKYGIVPKYERGDSNNFLQGFIVNWLPMLLLLGFFLFFLKQIQSGGGKAMSFGKSRAKLLTENKNRVTFKEVAGVDEAKDDLQEIVNFLKDPRKYTKLGGRIPKGVLLVGSPGTGKTLLARAVAGEAGVPFYTISGSDFVEMFVGVGASRVRDLFEQGKKNAPCLIFIDEIDAVGRHRGAGTGGGHHGPGDRADEHHAGYRKAHRAMEPIKDRGVVPTCELSI